MAKHSLPSELRDLAEDEAVRRDYERLWSLLQEKDARDASDPRAGDAADDRVDGEVRDPGQGEDPAFDVDDAWNDLARTLDLDAETPTSESNSQPTASRDSDSRDPDARTRSDRPPEAGGQAGRRGLWTAVRGAAVAVLVVLAGAAGTAVWWTQPVEVSTTPGEQVTATLPDGSTVQLNGETSLSYPRGFARLPAWTAWVPGVTRSETRADVRSVTLRGEAYFSVTSGERPFRVETANAHVEVLGTAFNVRARDEGEAPVTEVVVSEGRVRVASRSGAQSNAGSGSPSPPAEPGEAGGVEASSPGSVVLDAPGRSSRLVGTTPPTRPQTIDLKYAGAWRTGGFAVRNAQLPDVLRELEIRFGTRLRLDAEAAARPMTLHYARSVQLEDILHDVCVLQGLSYRQTQNGYVLVPADR